MCLVVICFLGDALGGRLAPALSRKAVAPEEEAGVFSKAPSVFFPWNGPIRVAVLVLGGHRGVSWGVKWDHILAVGCRGLLW